MSENNDEMIDELVAAGAIQLEGIDEQTGEFLYRITTKMKDVNKPLYDEHMNNIYSDVMYFWERGLVEFDDFASQNPNVALTGKAFDLEYISSIDPDKRVILERIKESLGLH